MAKRFINAANLPLTAEGFQEEREFDAAQAKSGGQLRRISTGFVLHAPGVIRHFADSDDMRAHVFNGGEVLGRVKDMAEAACTAAGDAEVVKIVSVVCDQGAAPC